MTKNLVNDEQLGVLARRQHDLFRRVREGSVSVEFALAGLQALIEGRTLFPVWKTVQIGGKTKDVLIAEMESKGFKIGDYARSMLGKKAFTTLSESVELALARVTVQQLGLSDRATTLEIWDRAKDLKLGLCPPEVGPHLRLADADQANGDWYWIAMEPITGAVGYPSVFSVAHGDFGRWLDSGDAGRAVAGSPGIVSSSSPRASSSPWCVVPWSIRPWNHCPWTDPHNGSRAFVCIGRRRAGPGFFLLYCYR